MKKYFPLLLVLVFCGCTHAYIFKDTPPVQDLQDRNPSAVPAKNDFNYVEYAVTSSVRYPLVETLDTRRHARSGDVNSLDQVPASAWYTPRIGYKSLSPEELLEGPVKIGPPQAPLKIIKAKTKGNSPGFIIEDSRGKKYLLKFDPSDYPDLESTINLVVNRLFWGFGYNVPEDFLFTFTQDQLLLSKDSGVTQDDVDKVLILAPAPDDDGRYRVTASLFVDGTVLGPIPQRGTRKGDSNDRIPHEDLRILRALRVFSAWLDNSGIRSDNSLDVYQGAEGRGHTVHYLLDFGEAMGAHGVEKDRVWDGFEHFFSYQDTAKNYLLLGFPVKSWEKLEIDPADPRGSFEAEAFQFSHWRETTQFMPMRQSQPDDDYWAAKIIASVTPAQLKNLLEATKHPDKDYIQYLFDTLLKRREKILADVFSRVSPLESMGVKNGKLQVEDAGRKLASQTQAGSFRYEVRYYNKKHKRVAAKSLIEGKESSFELPVGPELMKAAKGYLRVEIRRIHDGKKAPRSAQFHLLNDGSGNPRLAGVVH